MPARWVPREGLVRSQSAHTALLLPSCLLSASLRAMNHQPPARPGPALLVAVEVNLDNRLQRNATLRPATRAPPNSLPAAANLLPACASCQR